MLVSVHLNKTICTNNNIQNAYLKKEEPYEIIIPIDKLKVLSIFIRDISGSSFNRVWNAKNIESQDFENFVTVR